MAGAYDGSRRLRPSGDRSARKHRCRSGADSAVGAGRETTIRAVVGATAPPFARCERGPMDDAPSLSCATQTRGASAGTAGTIRVRASALEKAWRWSTSSVSVWTQKSGAGDQERVGSCRRVPYCRTVGWRRRTTTIRSTRRRGRPSLDAQLPKGAFSRIRSQATSRCLAPVGRGRPPPLCVSPPKHRSLLPSFS